MRGFATGGLDSGLDGGTRLELAGLHCRISSEGPAPHPGTMPPSKRIAHTPHRSLRVSASHLGCA